MAGASTKSEKEHDYHVYIPCPQLGGSPPADSEDVNKTPQTYVGNEGQNRRSEIGGGVYSKKIDRCNPRVGCVG